MKRILILAIIVTGIEAEQFVIMDKGCIRILGIHKGWIRGNPIYKARNGKNYTIKNNWGIFDKEFLRRINPKYFCKRKENK